MEDRVLNSGLSVAFRDDGVIRAAETDQSVTIQSCSYTIQTLGGGVSHRFTLSEVTVTGRLIGTFRKYEPS